MGRKPIQFEVDELPRSWWLAVGSIFVSVLAQLWILFFIFFSVLLGSVDLAGCDVDCVMYLTLFAGAAVADLATVALLIACSVGSVTGPRFRQGYRDSMLHRSRWVACFFDS